MLMRQFLQKQSLLLPVVAGLLQYAALPPLSLWPLSCVSLVPLFFFIEREKRWHRLLWGTAAYMLTYIGLAIFFIPDPLLIFSGVLLFCVIYVPLVILCTHIRQRHTLFFLGLAAAYTLAQYTLAQWMFLPAFPIMLGIPLAETPLQYAALFGGTVGASAYVALINALVAMGLYAHYANKKRMVWAAGAACGALFVVCASAPLFLRIPPSPPIRTMVVATGDTFAEDAKDFDDKSAQSSPQYDRALNTFLEHTLAPIGEAVDKEQPTLVVLPEHVIDMTLPHYSDEEARRNIGVTNAGPLLRAYADFAHEHHVFLMTSLTTFDTYDKKHISTVLIHPTGVFAYITHKQHLTIVSEYWPFGSWLPFYWRWEASLLPQETRQHDFIAFNPTGQFEAGSDTPLAAIGTTRIGTTVCGEADLPTVYTRTAQAGGQLVVHTGNDTWLMLLRSSYQALTIKFQTLESLRTGLFIASSVRGAAPKIVFPDGSILAGRMPKSGEWTYVVK